MAEDAFAVARRGRRRANASAPRSKRIVLRVTESEDAMLRSLADAQGVTVQALLMRAALAGGSEEAARLEQLREELAGARFRLATVANNVNQLAHQANSFDLSGGTPVTGEEVFAVAASVREAMARIDAVTGRVEQ